MVCLPSSHGSDNNMEHSWQKFILLIQQGQIKKQAPKSMQAVQAYFYGSEKNIYPKI